LVITIDNQKKSFNSGDLTIDFIDFVHWIKEECTVAFSSSWDHFFKDGNKYKTIHIDHDNHNKVIADFSKVPLSTIDKVIEYPVTKDITTFEELKTYYRLKRPKK
ncbi:MAG: hypothetical protein ACC656_14490, partial [Candidatus Heimdallarchaeota archaeon]